MRLYHAVSNASRNVFRHPGAVLDCAFQDDSRAFSGGLDCVVRLYVPAVLLKVLAESQYQEMRLNSEALNLVLYRLDLHRDPQDGMTTLGAHEKEVKCVLYSNRMGTAITGGWDGAVLFW